MMRPLLPATPRAVVQRDDIFQRFACHLPASRFGVRGLLLWDSLQYRIPEVSKERRYCDDRRYGRKEDWR
jgi:hypothetical protein